MENRVNITPILNHLLGIGAMKDRKKELPLLIKALRNMKENEFPSFAEMAEMMKQIQTKKVIIKNIYKKVLELENAGKIDYDISDRGGHYGLSRGDVADLLGLGGYADYLPSKVGAFRSNSRSYDGGILIDSITTSGYDKNLPAKYAKRVDAFTDACKKRYIDLENLCGLNDEEAVDLADEI